LPLTTQKKGYPAVLHTSCQEQKQAATSLIQYLKVDDDDVAVMQGKPPIPGKNGI
jgi:hypothetical protein